MGRRRENRLFSLYRRPAKNGDRIYQCRLLDPETGAVIETKSTGETDKAKAWTAALKMVEKSPDERDPFFPEFMRDFFKPDGMYVQLRRADGRELSKVYLEVYQSYIDRLLVPYPGFKQRRISQVSLHTLERFKLDMLSAKKPVSRRGLNLLIGAIRTALSWAHKRRLISQDPSVGLTKVKNDRRERGIITVDEIGKVINLEWNDPRQKGAVLLGCLAGLRRGEARGLRWRSVDLEKHEIRVIDNWTPYDKDRGKPKTGETRIVPTSPQLEDMLAELKKANPYGAGPDDFVLYNVSQDKPIHESTIKRGFRLILNAIGITDEEIKERNLTYHGLRHSFVSLARQTLPAFVVGRLSGHKSGDMIERYSHTSQEDLDRGRQALTIVKKKTG